jgi:hypothetical protein
MSLKVRRIIGAGVVILLLASVAIYTYFFVWPKKQLAGLLVEFELACRSNDVASLELLVSKDAPIYGKWETFCGEFAKFEQDIEVYRASYVLGGRISEHTMIMGHARMRAKIDGDYRFFEDIALVKEEGSWRIRQFGFPDFLDY